jgi:hypothetical protein
MEQIYLAGKVDGTKWKVAEALKHYAKFVASDGGNHSEHGFGGAVWLEYGALDEAVKSCATDQIAASSRLLAILDQADSYGSIAEIAYASAIGIPVLMIIIDQHVHAFFKGSAENEEFDPHDPDSHCLRMYDAYWFVACFPGVDPVVVESLTAAVAAAHGWLVGNRAAAT